MLSALMTITLLAAASRSVIAEKPAIGPRMTHHRAIDAAVWAMPLMNYKFYRDALIDNGVGANDVGSMRVAPT